jgi:hypothetical protein
VAAAGSYIQYATFLMKLLHFHHWSHVTLLVQDKTVTTFYKVIASEMLGFARPKNNNTLNIEMFTFNPVNISMKNALIYAKTRSRGTMGNGQCAAL